MGMEDILKPQPGAIVNRYKERKRRNVAFFDVPFSEYIRHCESSGKPMKETGFGWGSSYTEGIIHQMADRPQALALINNSMHLLWKSMGLLESCLLSEEGSDLVFKTAGECFTRTIGKNSFTTGLYKGVFSTLYGSVLDDISSTQTQKDAQYVYRITGKKFQGKCRDSDEYYRLNEMPSMPAYTLDDAKRDGFVKGMEISGRHIQLIESTLFHVCSNSNIDMGKLAELTSEHLKGILPESASGKAVFLKKFLELGGWGLVNVSVSKNLKVIIKGPPCGFQPERDNFSYLGMTCLGIIGPCEFSLGKSSYNNGLLSMEFIGK